MTKTDNYRARLSIFVGLAIFTSSLFTSSVFAEERIHINRSHITFTDRNITSQTVINLDLSEPSSFDLTVNAPTYGNGGDRNYFYLNPRTRRADNRVKVHIDFPYEQVTPGGPYKLETVNTVKLNQQKMATNQYSLCPASEAAVGSHRVCKPLSFVVIDEGSIPGVIYETQLTLLVNSKSGQQIKETVTLTYENTRSAIGIYSPNDRFHLETRNRFTAENSFCVYSRGETRSFDVSLEGSGAGHSFELTKPGADALGYQAFYGNSGSAYQITEPTIWNHVGLTKQVNQNFTECGADRNLWVKLHIPDYQVKKSTAGYYTGTLLVRVRAQ